MGSMKESVLRKGRNYCRFSAITKGRSNGCTRNRHWLLAVYTLRLCSPINATLNDGRL
ncbi:hypothetical protein J6590_073842 [Homalodisca vitripennis]|nr:hypothetical protein J6590_073842 [Homalodisca vitripennis]